MPPITPVRTVAAIFVAILTLFSLTGVQAVSAAEAKQSSFQFATPSGKISCYFDNWASETTTGSCIANSSSWKRVLKKPTDCDLDWSESEMWLESTTSGKSYINKSGAGVCRGDISNAICVAKCQVLPYGKSETTGNIMCTSKTTGVTCVTINGKRTGFTVNKAGYTLIN